MKAGTARLTSTWGRRTARRGRAPSTGGTEPAGFHAACRSHSWWLFSLARYELDDAQLAERVVLETVSRAWRGRHGFDAGQGSMRTWLWDLQRSVIDDMVGGRAPVGDPMRTVATPWASDVAQPSPRANPSDGEWLTGVLGRLSPELRHVLVELHYRGGAAAEVAAGLGISEDEVRRRLSAALRQVRAELDSRDAPDAPDAPGGCEGDVGPRAVCGEPAGCAVA